MKLCPVHIKNQCQFWSTSVVTLIFILAAMLVVAHLDSFERWHLATKTIILSITAITAAWSLWAVRTLYAIITWWVDIKYKIAEAVDLLHEAKTDIKDMKSTSHEFSSR
jgi:hypothetical protein